MTEIRSIDICPPMDASISESQRYINDKLNYAQIREEQMLNEPSLISDAICKLMNLVSRAKAKCK